MIGTQLYLVLRLLFLAAGSSSNQSSSKHRVTDCLIATLSLAWCHQTAPVKHSLLNVILVCGLPGKRLGMFLQLKRITLIRIRHLICWAGTIPSEGVTMVS